MSYIRQVLGSVLSRRRKIIKRSFLMPAESLGRDMMIDVYRPAVPPWRLLSLVIFNDGQDLKRMNFENRIRAGYENDQLSNTLIVGVHAGEERMREYGTAGQPDYENRGDKAKEYESFIIKELIPWLEGYYNIYHNPGKRAIAGFSMGGLSAFDMAWRNPSEFGAAGVFSGSLWWRRKAMNPGAPDADLIVHDYVRKAKTAPPVKFWFMAGTDDEDSDRNNNGIIDSIDDTLQLMSALSDKGMTEGTDFTYTEVKGGKHEPETWGEVVVDFLRWLGEKSL